MKITNLASGSKGNCTLIQTNNKNILIDIGLPMSNLEKRLTKQDKRRVRVVLNCNTWLQGICENKYNNMVHDPVTIEEKRSIEETIKLRI